MVDLADYVALEERKRRLAAAGTGWRREIIDLRDQLRRQRVLLESQRELIGRLREENAVLRRRLTCG